MTTVANQQVPTPELNVQRVGLPEIRAEIAGLNPDPRFDESFAQPVMTKLREGGETWAMDQLVGLLDKKLRQFTKRAEGGDYEKVHSRLSGLILDAIIEDPREMLYVHNQWNVLVLKTEGSLSDTRPKRQEPAQPARRRRAIRHLGAISGTPKVKANPKDISPTEKTDETETISEQPISRFSKTKRTSRRAAKKAHKRSQVSANKRPSAKTKKLVFQAANKPKKTRSGSAIAKNVDGRHARNKGRIARPI